MNKDMLHRRPKGTIWGRYCSALVLAMLIAVFARPVNAAPEPPPMPPSTPTSTPVTVQPTVTVQPQAACTTSTTACARNLLKLLNRHRKAVGAQPLGLLKTQSDGTSSCVGSYGHSRAMARSHTIWHINGSYPRASFPRDLCVPALRAGENVGMTSSGSVPDALKFLDAAMMGEPHSRATCATTIDHACNILNPGYRQVGIGIYVSGGATWLTEDFIG